jgi:hypothetical protein
MYHLINYLQHVYQKSDSGREISHLGEARSLTFSRERLTSVKQMVGQPALLRHRLRLRWSELFVAVPEPGTS